MKVVFITNILTPYRKYFFDVFNKYCILNKIELLVFVMAAEEPDRNWKYQELKADYTRLLTSKTISIGSIYFHFNKELIKEIKKVNPDLVIGAGSYLSPSIWELIKNKRNLKYKLYFWSESHLNEKREYSFFKYKVREIIRNYVYKKFDGFLYAGQLSKEFILKYSNDNPHLIFTPNLVNEITFQKSLSFSNEMKNYIKEKNKVEENKFVFICPARLTKVKGIMEFLALFNKCKNKDNSIILIAGDGELKKEIENYSSVNHLNVRCLGYKTEEQLIELYSIADCFLLPSLSDANPLSCIEALWSGLPLLISEHVGNVNEVLYEGINGECFSYRDEDDAIRKIDKIISMNKEWKIQAKYSSQKIAQNLYDSEKSIQQIIHNLPR